MSMSQSTTNIKYVTYMNQERMSPLLHVFTVEKYLNPSNCNDVP